ncbi:flavin-containing monooxygenase [Microbacterium marinilacus]|uniref:NAD(P)/FAD-dependent oxidoreductase n=1 Tax=Microbacterium marinilacus TaxID=415209 RepID=A0ABP7BL49_9MICO|nr:NAD(P)/FAD-dependent oxidoreductase [Microbacterium marinilacus]MBY0689685.1 NAD(P)/FAD-dependent oxidoreductase [Microbacterium marinilacus]
MTTPRTGDAGRPADRVGTVIVGAGFAGIAAAMALRAEGVSDFVILERASGVGGTWRENVYPGVACDVPAHLYGLSAHPWPGWSRTFAPGAEIRSYLEHVVHAEGLDSRLRLGTALTDARWVDDGWVVSTVSSPSAAEAGDRVLHADHLILACGRLTEPVIPDVPGLDGFPGPVFHSARWDERIRIQGARIAVVGTGASAVQLVPQLARQGADVTLFQRTPAWIVPRRDRAYARAERDAWAADPASLAALRDELYAEGEARFASRSGDPAASESAREAALGHLARQVPDPGLRSALTPDYAFGCKRVLLSDDFYPTIADGSVRLEASALAAVDDNWLIAASGARHQADVIVLATGFEAARQPYARLVTGEHGLTLDEHWSTGMTSVASTLVHGFPNLHVLNGPNASLGHNSAVLIMEQQAAFSAALVAGGRTVRVTAEAEAEYTAEIAARAAGTPWIEGGCRNWYTDPRSGRLTLLWPGTVADFGEQLARARDAILAPSLIP